MPASHHARVAEILRALFPQNADLQHLWLTKPNRAFQGQIPGELMKSAIGYETVLRYLESHLQA